MWSCETCRRHLPQYVADGGVPEGIASELAAHLSGCAACRGYVERLGHVEEALRDYPLRIPSPELSEGVMHVVASESRRREEEWVLLPWDVWLPALAVLVALVVAVAALPTRTFGVQGSLVGLGDASMEWSQSVLQRGTALLRESREGDFWAVWTAASLALAVLGISIGWSGWCSANDEAHRQVQMRLAHVTDWLGGLIGPPGRSQ